MPRFTDDSSTHELLDWSSGKSFSSRWSGHDSQKWPTEPQPLEKWNSARILSILLDIVLLGLAVCFAAFGISVRRWEGTPVDSSTYQTLARTARLAPTIFPILFAAIIGRALKAIALWRLEKGARLGHLDQLVGSTSITTTVTTQFKLRALNLLSITLIGIWALSPLGGQGSIRILETTTQYTNTSTDVQFLNLTFYPAQYESGDTAGSFAQSNSLFAAALSSPLETRDSAIDTWGNVKIPVLEVLDASKADSDGWVTPPLTGGEYASLIGLPLSTITANSETTFNVETSYWNLDCPPLSVLDYNPAHACNISGWSDVNTQSSIVPGMYMSSYANNMYDVWNRSDTDCRQLAYCGWDTENATAVNCTMKSSYVEVQVHCIGVSCNVSRIRESRANHPPVCWTQLDHSGFDFSWYAIPLVQSLGNFHVAFITPFQGFLVRPTNPFNLTGLGPVSDLSPSTFALRLAQLMNTYWYAFLGSSAVQYGVSNQDLNRTTESAGYIGGIVGVTPATVQKSQPVIACNHSWLVILFLAVIVLVVISIAGIVATSLSMSPDIAFNVSSMIKDSPHVTLPFGGSTLPAGDRSRLLKHVRVRYGDVDGDEAVGSIAIATPRATALRKNRLYV